MTAGTPADRVARAGPPAAGGAIEEPNAMVKRANSEVTV
jgi:hypothetical protein